MDKFEITSEIWDKSLADTLFFDGREAWMDNICSVNIEGSKITISYHDDDNGIVTYEGTSEGDGHFVLRSRQVNGTARLHKFPNGKILEGSWIEDGIEGMWRIRLGKK